MSTSESPSGGNQLTVNLSVVVPCFNEEASLPIFMGRIEQACQNYAFGPYEIIFVNDGSTDLTWNCIKLFSATRPGVIGINLARNHGHQLAVSAGLARTRGKRVLVIDADLQDPPELLEPMMLKMDAGADVVYGRRNQRAGETKFKLFTATMFYNLLSAISSTRIPQDTGDFRLMRRRIVDLLNDMPEQDRFLRGMVAWLGGTQVEVAYDRPPREAGKSGYGFWKMVKLAASGITSFSTLPLRMASLLSACGFVLGLAMICYTLIGYLSGRNATGWTSLALLITGFSVAQLACTAILGSYIGRIFMQVKGRPLFIVSEVAQSPAHLGLPSFEEIPPGDTISVFAELRTRHG